VDSDDDGPPRALLIAAIVVAVSAVIAILVVAVLRQRDIPDAPVAIVAIPAPEADSTQCRTVIDALPEQLGEFGRAALAQPAPPGTAAWRAAPEDEAVVLRCGIDRPAEFVLGSPLQAVDDVTWFRVGEATDEPGADQARSTWFAVDRPVYVALTLPAGSGPEPIQLISRVIAKSLPAKAVEPAPIR
jgi:hypothetical protein